jgi:predicted dehydrogenase
VEESPRGVILAGLGPYARKTYYPLLQRYARQGAVRIAAVIDLESQRAAVEEYLAAQAIQPEMTFFVSDRERGGDRLSARLDAAVLSSSRRPWGCIVSTEPRYHRWYTQWAQRRGLRVLLEKPISALDLGRARPGDALAMVEDYARIAELSRRHGLPVIVQSQRRAHQAYVDIKATGNRRTVRRTDDVRRHLPRGRHLQHAVGVRVAREPPVPLRVWEAAAFWVPLHRSAVLAQRSQRRRAERAGRAADRRAPGGLADI